MQRSAGALPLVFLLFAGALCAQPATYAIEPSEEGRFDLKVYKSGLYSGKAHVFVFDRYEGTFAFDPDDPEQSTAEFVVESDSIRCLDDWVNEKERAKILKEARGNMLAVEQYPRIRFEAKGLKRVEGTTFAAEGRLTIRDQTRNVQVTVAYIPAADGANLRGSAVVSLKDFGLDPPSAAFGLIGTKSEMDVEFAFDLAPAKE